MTTAWFPAENALFGQAIEDTSSVKKQSPGQVVRAKHATYGVAEFIYLKGVASTVAGSIVNYDDSFQTALHSSALDHPRPLAIAMAANTSGYGWYQIGRAYVMASVATGLIVEVVVL